MDLNSDGFVDILSGSYSRHDRNMAGLFQVLWGTKEKTFRAAEVLKGSDGEPLILPAGGGSDVDVERICTRGFAADMNGDGALDLVSGNFAGTFVLFLGKGKGAFEPTGTWMTVGGSNKRLEVDAHSDPFLVDWDKDGDLDLLSGSAQGGVFLFKNVGTKKEPKFGAKETLVKAAGYRDGDQIEFGDAHVKAPMTATRVWAEDLNGDGKLDLVIGDSATLISPAKGLSEDEARDRLKVWNKKLAELSQNLSANSEGGEEAAGSNDARQKEMQSHYEAREAIVKEDMTGFVWVLYQR